MTKLRFISISDIHGNIDAVSKLVKSRISQKEQFNGIIISGDFPATIPFILVTQYILRWRNLSRLGYSRKVYHEELRNQFVKLQITSTERMLSLLQKFNLPIYYVAGNVETREVIHHMKHKYDKIQFLEDKESIINNKYLLTGIGGSLEHLGIICDHEFSTESFNKRIDEKRRKFESKYSDLDKIFIFHEPPKFFRDVKEMEKLKKKAKKRFYKYDFHITAGSQSLFNLIKKFDPILAINGHYHEYAGRRIIKKTVVINPGPLATYNYALITISDDKRYKKVDSKFYKIKSNQISFIKFLYQKRTYTNSTIIVHQ